MDAPLYVIGGLSKKNLKQQASGMQTRLDMQGTHCIKYNCVKAKSIEDEDLAFKLN